jgi:hypothetical protein
MGIDYVMDRIRTYRQRLSQVNRAQKFGMHYEDEDAQIMEKIRSDLNKSYPIID